jgi:hypothetical protein
MNAEQFVYWVQGKFEDRDIGNISHDEALRIMKSIKEHVATVFKKVTPEVTLDPNQKTDFEELIKKALPTHTTGPRSFEYDKSGYWLNPNGVPVTLTC